MDFSAFLGLRMGKEKPSVTLKPVDEEAGQGQRFVRLHKDSVEEVEEELPPVKVGKQRIGEGTGPTAREHLKMRSNEPDIGSLIAREGGMLEENWEAEGSARLLPWGWIALIGIAFAVGILWSLVQVNRGGERLTEIQTATQGIAEQEVEEEAAAVDMIGNIEEAASGFYGANSIEELLEYVRQPERVRPLMEDYYAGRSPESARVLRINSMEPLTIENRAKFWLVEAEVSPPVASPILVEVDSVGGAKVDWETLVVYQPMDWDDFALDRPVAVPMDFRVYAEPDHFYSHEFGDAELYVCYRLTTPGGDETLFGYVERGAELAERMRVLLAQNKGGAMPMILKLHVPENLQSRRGVVISELLNPSWMFVESPEEGF